MLGSGGFGVVYLGRHKELGAQVAIKEYFPVELAIRRFASVEPRSSGVEAPFEDGMRRFLEEARQLEAFREHPNIVTCRDFFRANGTAYMVMDYVPGLSLSELLRCREAKSDPFTESDMRDVMIPLLGGLRLVHDSGVFHRDVKPSNILIRRTDNQPVLIDFGTAKQEASGVTKSMAPYTDGYAAMEQVGDGEVGTWTDIYGVGATMWRMVAGSNPPWVPPNPVKVQTRAYEVLQGNSDPLPSAKRLGSDRYSPGLLAAIDGCLGISVSSRIRTCDDLLERIRRPATRVPFESTSSSSRAERQSHSAQLRRPKSRINPASVFLTLFAVALLLAIGLALRENRLTTAEAQAQFELGVAYATGDGESQDYHEALRLFRLAADQGNASAQYNLGWMYYHGNGVTRDYQVALKWFRLAADQGNATAQLWLGIMYANGIGAIQDDDEAERWYRLAADQGNADAQANLGWMYANNEGGTCCDDYEEMLRLFSLAAGQGNAGGQCGLGWMYSNGNGVGLDYQEALRLYRLAADQGHATAQLWLGIMYANGNGVTRDYQEAVKWYRLAADQGNASAQYNLGWMYSNGNGVTRDYQVALKWYRLAADQGHATAQNNLDRIQD